MTKATRVLGLLALLAGAAAGAPPAGPDIRLPQPAVVPTPMPPPTPAPDPGGVVTLSGDEWYVVDSSVDVVVRAHPRGVIKFERKKPGAFYGRFAGGGGRLEEREFAGPFVWVGRAAGKGRVTVDVIPKGLKGEEEIVSGVVEADAAGGACPEPGPKPPNPPGPGPTPDPKPPEPAKTFRVILVYESGDTLTAAQNAVLYGKAVEEYLTGRCTGGKSGWGRRDKDADPAADTTALKELWAAVKPKVTSTPAVAVAVNENVVLEPLPATPAGAVALLKKYAGDK